MGLILDTCVIIAEERRGTSAAELLKKVSLEKLALQRGVELKRHGADLIGLCPFHDDRERCAIAFGLPVDPRSIAKIFHYGEGGAASSCLTTRPGII